MRMKLPSPLLVVAFCLMLGLAQTASAQNDNNPFQFGQNYFVTGDYVVAGVGLRGLGDGSGYAMGTITMPDANTVPAGGVPAGAQVVAALLYWQTVESSQTSFAGQTGFFRPVFPGGPAQGYPIAGQVLGNPNTPVSWSSGGCSGNSNGSKTIRTYREDVSGLLPQDSTGNVIANGTYEVRLADSGSNGGGTPLTLGATLVIIYRQLDTPAPLKSIVIYDGSVSPANGSSTMSQTMQGFYQAAASPISKLTHIAGNGQPNKFETVYLDNVALPSLYTGLPPFPGIYNDNTISPSGGGSWDNPTWSFPNTYLNGTNPVAEDDLSAATSVVPASSNSGCVTWGAVIISTTVKDTDGDGLLNVWETGQGYCDAAFNEGVCSPGDASWVDLTGADSTRKDLFVEIDYMCSSINSDGTCSTIPPNYSFYPPPGALTKIKNAFAPHGINVHFVTGNSGYTAPYNTGAIQEQTCTDTTDSSGNPVLCPFLNQPGIVGWKWGFWWIKNRPLNKNSDGTTWTEGQCEQAPTTCVRQFQHGRKDSYHYVLFAHALGQWQWSFHGGGLNSVAASGNTVTFNMSVATGLVVNPQDSVHGRVSIGGAITNPSLNGTYYVQSVGADGKSFTINTATATSLTSTYTALTDPQLLVSSGRVATTSGFSDIGGADSVVALGLWPEADRTEAVEASTLMHELGHSLGLTHGGTYYDVPGVATYGANCKPNYQSVMNYLFEVDLLTNGGLDYSEQDLNTLDEDGLLGGLTTSDGSPLAFSTTGWYTPDAPGGVGTPATHYCDGTPFSTDPPPTMYRVFGTANPFTPSFLRSSADVNFDGSINLDGSVNTPLRGYNDWTSVNLRQVGFSGASVLGGGNFVGLGGNFVGLGGNFVGLGGNFASPELDLATANSTTRPPQTLTAALTSTSPRYIVLNWNAPTFGAIAYFNVYRSTNGATAVNITPSGGVASLTFTDTTVNCDATYTYFATAVLAGTNPPQESTPSNTTDPISVPCTFVGFLSPLATAGTVSAPTFSGTEKQGSAVPIKWEILDSSGNPIGDLSTLKMMQACPTTGKQVPPPTSSTCVLLYSPSTGAKGNSTFRFSSPQFIFNWDTTSTIGSVAGYFTIEVTLSDGSAVKATTVQFK
jgi:hypothetical protein